MDDVIEEESFKQRVADWDDIPERIPGRNLLGKFLVFLVFIYSKTC